MNTLVTIFQLQCNCVASKGPEEFRNKKKTIRVGNIVIASKSSYNMFMTVQYLFCRIVVYIQLFLPNLHTRKPQQHLVHTVGVFSIVFLGLGLLILTLCANFTIKNLVSKPWACQVQEKNFIFI